MTDKIKWCLKKNKGIELVEPNDNLARAYLGKAENAHELQDRMNEL